MNKYIKFPILMAACIVLAVGATGIFSRAESATAQDNLEKLKKTNSCPGCDLSGLTLNRIDLAGADLEGADFSLTKFHLSNLSGANLRNANLKGASFGGTDLGEADLRGADLRGTSLEGAYLEQTLLDGEFVTAKPYEEIGVTDVEKQVYVPNPEKPKKSPETRDVKVAARRDAEETPPRTAVEQGARPSSEKKTGTATADKVAAKPDEQQTAAPAAKKAVPVRQAIVEPQEPAEQAMVAEPAVAPKSTQKKDEAIDSGVGSLPTPERSPKKMARTGKPSPVPPAEVKMDEMQTATSAKPMSEEGAGKPGVNPVADKGKKERLTRLLEEEKCLGCDLSGLDLSGKNLRSVDLERANLTGCNLERVNLEKANLKGAILQNAILRMASLKNADLYKADLSGADLSGANVQGAKLDNAKLSTVVGLGTEPVVKQ